jgi:hypothetical protein
MRLTKYQKDVIVKAIFADVPEPDAKAIQKMAQEALVAAMSPACQVAYKSCPKALISTSTWSITHHDRLGLIVGDADIDETLKPFYKAEEDYIAAKCELTHIIGSCSTLKQLEQVLPEFKSYFPTEGVPTKNLPTTNNLVASMIKLGWKP